MWSAHGRPHRDTLTVLRSLSKSIARKHNFVSARLSIKNFTPVSPWKSGTLEIVMDLLVAICLLPPLRCHMRYRVSPPVIATDASESGFVVVRPSTLTLEGSDEQSLRALSTAVACDQLGMIELNVGIGYLRRSVELLERVPGVNAASAHDTACCRLLETAWPTSLQLPQVAAVRSTHIAQLVQFASHVTVWQPCRCIRDLTEAHSAVPRARKTNSFIILDGS